MREHTAVEMSLTSGPYFPMFLCLMGANGFKNGPILKENAADASNGL